MGELFWDLQSIYSEYVPCNEFIGIYNICSQLLSITNLLQFIHNDISALIPFVYF